LWYSLLLRPRGGRPNQSLHDTTVWQGHIDYLSGLFTKARCGQDTRTFVQSVARRYSANSDSDRIYKTSTAFSAILTRATRLEEEIWSRVGTGQGAGQYLDNIQRLRSGIKEAIGCLDDVWEAAILGEFHEKYETAALRYQQLLPELM
jgi:hypothetical protein